MVNWGKIENLQIKNINEANLLLELPVNWLFKIECLGMVFEIFNTETNLEFSNTRTQRGTRIPIFTIYLWKTVFNFTNVKKCVQKEI